MLFMGVGRGGGGFQKVCKLEGCSYAVKKKKSGWK